MTSRRSIRAWWCLVLVYCAVASGCQNMANVAADKHAGELPPQWESEE